MRGGGRGRRAIVWGLATAILAGAIVWMLQTGRADGVWHTAKGTWDGFAGWVEGVGFWGPAVCAGALVLATLLFLPTTVPLLAAGALFGVWGGLLVGWAGLGAGMCAAFGLSRCALRERLREKYGERDIFRRMERALEREGWKYVVTVRLMPINPYPLVNYLLGLTSIRFRTYALSSLAGVTPVMALYVLLGHAAGCAASGDAVSVKVAGWLFAGAVLFALAVFGVPRLCRRNRQGGADGGMDPADK